MTLDNRGTGSRCVLTCALPTLGLSPRSPRRMRDLGERLVLMRSVKTNKALLLSEVTRPWQV